MFFLIFPIDGTEEATSLEISKTREFLQKNLRVFVCLDKGEIVSTHSRNEEETLKYTAQSGDSP